jgi:hypothetical protein
MYKMLKKLLLISISMVTLAGCGIKDPSFYDLQSPCVANEYLGYPYADISDNPCIKSIPNLNNHFDAQIQVM